MGGKENLEGSRGDDRRKLSLRDAVLGISENVLMDEFEEEEDGNASYEDSVEQEED